MKEIELTLRPQLGDKMKIKCSGETGEVIGRAVFPTAESKILLRYKSADGRAVEAWWNLSALETV